MKILYLTGGAGRMYCGSCLRDNALATELIARGHDVVLLPVYTPTHTDEPNVSENKVVLGGISAYLEQYVPFFRKTPAWLDALWDSKVILDLASRRSISTNPKMLGEMTVSVLKGEDGFQRKEIHKLIDWLKRQPLPEVISLPYSLLLGLAGPLKRELNRPICCALQGEDLFLDGLQEPYRDQALALIRSNIKHVDLFLPISEFYAEFTPGYLGIPAEKMRVVPIGINLEGFERATPAEKNGFTVGFLGRVAPEKGLHLVAEAYKLFREHTNGKTARLEAAGWMAPESEPYLDEIKQRFAEWGLASEFHYRGVLDRDRKIEFLRQLDVMSVPAIYDEPKGVSLLEAMACGVPLVQPRRGAFTEIVEKTSGGLLVEPDNAQSLADGLLEIFQNRPLAEQVSREGARGVRLHYSAAHMADRALEAYESVIGR
ncbi:MAG TPA: glycosyltransferase family 4 protein [Pyrinomonadaceae bacterium]|nr:glycosyltransferase family 4 protein [Pyrinomonadaceae bacterium]